MKLKYISMSGKIVDVSIADAIEGSIDRSYNGGRIEDIESRLNDLTRLVGTLVEALYDNHKLTDEQLKSMLSWQYKTEE